MIKSIYLHTRINIISWSFTIYICIQYRSMHCKYHFGSLLEPCWYCASSTLIDKLCCDCTVCCRLLLRSCYTSSWIWKSWLRLCTRLSKVSSYLYWCVLPTTAVGISHRCEDMITAVVLKRWCMDISIRQLPLMLMHGWADCSIAVCYWLCYFCVFGAVVAIVGIAVLLLSLLLCVCHNHG